MKEPVLRIVLFPRYTALYGDEIYTAPINVKEFAKAVVTAWVGTGIGSTPASGGVAVEQSADLEHWHQVGSDLSPDNAEESATFEFDLEWVRFKAMVSGTNPGVTLWAVGAFIPREKMSG
jgi:hypothetical protein